MERRSLTTPLRGGAALAGADHPAGGARAGAQNEKVGPSDTTLRASRGDTAAAKPPPLSRRLFQRVAFAQRGRAVEANRIGLSKPECPPSRTARAKR